MIVKFLNLLQKILNFKIQKNQGILLSTCSIAGFMICYTSAPITKEIVSNLPAEFLSVQSLVVCISSLIVGILWKGKTRQVAIRNFALLALSESIAAFCLAMWLVFVSYNVLVFAIGSLLYTSMISLFISKCVMCFKSKLWKEREREDFDNTSSIANDILFCLGFILSLCVMPPLKIAIFIWGIACIVDDIGWVTVYLKNKNAVLSGEGQQVSNS